MDWRSDSSESAEKHAAQFIFSNLNGLHINASWHFQPTLNAYIYWLFDALAENRKTLEKSTSIDLEKVRQELTLTGSEDGLDQEFGQLLGTLLEMAFARH